MPLTSKDSTALTNFKKKLENLKDTIERQNKTIDNKKEDFSMGLQYQTHVKKEKIENMFEKNQDAIGKEKNTIGASRLRIGLNSVDGKEKLERSDNKFKNSMIDNIDISRLKLAKLDRQQHRLQLSELPTSSILDKKSQLLEKSFMLKKALPDINMLIKLTDYALKGELDYNSKEFKKNFTDGVDKLNKKLVNEFKIKNIIEPGRSL